MAKDPAFLFYPNDYIGGTMGMTFEEKGAYIELLMMQFNRGHMTTHMIGQTVGQIWDTIKVKFEQDENGLWFNSRLDDEKEKRKRFTESRRNNIKGVNQHSKIKDHKAGHMTTHMENENEIKNENKKYNKKCLMKNSGLTLEQVSLDFLERDDLKNANAKYYYQAAMDWSDSKGEMRKDWMATVRSFARRDLADNKLKIKSSVTASRTNAAPPIPEDYGKPSETATPMPDSLKKRFEKIGQ